MLGQITQETPGPAGVGGNAMRQVCLASALYLLFALIMAVFNHYSPTMPPIIWALFGCASAIGYLLILVTVIRLLAHPTLTSRLEGGLAVIFLLVFLALNPAIWQMLHLLRHGFGFWQAVSALADGGGESSSSSFSKLFYLSAFPYLLILAGVFFGRLVARIMREKALLVPVGIIAGLIDFWGVYWGPVNLMSDKAPMAVGAIGSAATVAARVPDSALHKLSPSLAYIAQITPPDSIGLGDFVFLAIFLTCAYRLGFSAKRTMWGIFAGLLLSCLIMAMKGMTIAGHHIIFNYLPGLVFISGGLLLANIRTWKLTRQEWAMTGVVSLLIILLIGRSIVYAADNTPRAAVTANYQVAAPTANDALQAALTHIAHERNAPATLRIYQSAFIYLNSPKGAHLVEWEAIVFGLSKKVTLKQSQAYQLIGLPLDAQGKWKVMETAESPTADLLRSMKVPGNADPLSALMRIPELPSNAYRLLFNAQDDASLCKNEKGFIILLTPQGGKLLNLKQQLVKVLPYAK